MSSRKYLMGLAVVEMAIVLPLLMLLIISASEFGRAFIQYSRLSNRVQSAARFVADNVLQGSTGVPLLTDSIRSQARNLVVYGTPSIGVTPAVPALKTTDVEVTVTPDGLITVSLEYAYRPVVGDAIPTLGLGKDQTFSAILLRPKTVMRAL